MKDTVYVTVKGLQLANQDVDNEYDDQDSDPIEIINVGKYSVINGKEYIKYDEIYEGESEKSTCLIKIVPGNVEITKKGCVSTHLSFVEGEKTMTFYETPYGNIYLGVITRAIEIDRSDDQVAVRIDYALELNYEQISDCKVEIIVSSQGKLDLEKR